MTSSTSTQPQRLSRPASVSLGERLRQLRMSAGMTQTDLAGERFSKEYVSQIERGKTRPTAETIEWLAHRLGVDAGFLANGVSTDQRSRVETGLARAEALIELERSDDAVEEFENLHSAVLATGSADLQVRALCGEAWARRLRGEVREALELLNRSRSLAEGPDFSDVERADVLYRQGVCRYELASVATAIGLFNEALALAERSELPSDLLRSNILSWRSRCYRRQRDLEAAREDVERALELAEALNDRKTAAKVYFQASLVAERQGHWVLARSYAERARAYFEELSDEAAVGRLLNNLGGLNFLLGKPGDAIEFLKEAFSVALEVGNDAQAAQAVSSLAHVHLRTGDAQTAEKQARHALELLNDRVDFLEEIGDVQLVLGRSLLEQGRLDEAEQALGDAEASFDKLSSASHRAGAWVAQGDLAAKRGDDRTAARLFRQAAEALQDVHL